MVWYAQCNNGGSGGNIILRKSVGDDEGGGVPKQGECVKNSIDSCTHAQKKNSLV